MGAYYNMALLLPDQDKVFSDVTDESLKSRLEFERTWVDVMARGLTAELGRVRFLIVTTIFIVAWIALNIGMFGMQPFDPYPFGWLAILVSVASMLLAIIVLISQNRQGKIAEIRQQIEFEIDVRTEHEVTKILKMIDEIHREMGIAKVDSELEKMKKTTDIAEIKEKVEEVIEQEAKAAE